MTFKYTLYSQGKQLLAKSGLDLAIRDIMKSNKMPSLNFGVIYEDQISSFLDEMNAHFKKLPKEQKDFHKMIKIISKYPECFNYKIKKEETEKKPVDYDDLLVFSGYYASQFLNPNEIWDYKNAGFDSLSDFLGCIGAFVKSDEFSCSYFKKAHNWISLMPNLNSKEKIILLNSEVTGDSDCDLAVYQTDVTPYETTDPLGNRVFYRPELDSDWFSVSSVHSVEDSFLVSILKYADQENIRSKIIDNKTMFLSKFSKTLFEPQCCGDYSPGLCFVCCDKPLAKLDKDFKAEKDAVTDTLPTGNEDYAYGFFIGPEKELVIKTCKYRFNNPEKNLVQEDEQLVFECVKNENRLKDVCAIFQPGDIDELITSLFCQCARHLGRTSVYKLTQVLLYHNSEEYIIRKKQKA